MVPTKGHSCPPVEERVEAWKRFYRREGHKPLIGEFIRPRVERVFAVFRHNIVHLHSTGGYPPIDPVLEMRPTAVELHRDSGGPWAKELYPLHRKILAATPLLIWGRLDRDDLNGIFPKLSPERLGVQVVVESVEEAHDVFHRCGPSDV
jgi:hypothetical protein